jgi:hypothetical protein
MSASGASSARFGFHGWAHFLRNDAAQGMAEYSLVAATCAVVMIVVLIAMRFWSGNNLNGTQTKLSNEASNP